MRIALPAVLVATTLLAGCQQAPDVTPPFGYPDPVGAGANDPQIQVLSSDLRPWLGFQTPTVIRRDGAPLEIQVPVRNLANEQYLTEYRFVFFDANRQVVQPEMGWVMQPLVAKQTEYLRANALDTQAVDWKLEVRWSR
jgi:hypothetical protein